MFRLDYPLCTLCLLPAGFSTFVQNIHRIQLCATPMAKEEEITVTNIILTLTTDPILAIQRFTPEAPQFPEIKRYWFAAKSTYLNTDGNKGAWSHKEGMFMCKNRKRGLV
ncbi:uncharacterized protein [Lolium perenne]|uniref:uncharacterized protein isoform X5 n=1 Tax=Lolium perenne TaxID=4522 RepID=UPI003A9A22A4